MEEEKKKGTLSGKQIQSVQRAVDILNCFTASSPTLTLGQISARLGLNKGTVHGILNTLHNNGYISQNSSGQYMLGAELFNKAQLAPDTRRSVYIDQAQLYLQDLSDQFMANGSMFAFEGLYTLFLYSTEPRNSTFVIRRASTHMPLFCSASGKLLLAYLSEKEFAEYLKLSPFHAFTQASITGEQALRNELGKIRAQGFSVENNELFDGVSAIAVPIFSSYDNRIFGSISLTGMSVAIAKQRKEIVPALAETARRIRQSVRF